MGQKPRINDVCGNLPDKFRRPFTLSPADAVPQGDNVIANNLVKVKPGDSAVQPQGGTVSLRGVRTLKLYFRLLSLDISARGYAP
jgi:hypothetical protein